MWHPVLNPQGPNTCGIHCARVKSPNEVQKETSLHMEGKGYKSKEKVRD